MPLEVAPLSRKYWYLPPVIIDQWGSNAFDLFAQPWADALGIPVATVRKVFESSNDWTLIIQAHAVIEGAVNAAITRSVTPKKAADWILDTRTSFSRKLDFCYDLDLIKPATFRAFKALAALRNCLVHTPVNLMFAFDSHGLEESKLDGWMDKMRAAMTIHHQDPAYWKTAEARRMTVMAVMMMSKNLAVPVTIKST